jgi:hypothetical protein
MRFIRRRRALVTWAALAVLISSLVGPTAYAKSRAEDGTEVTARASGGNDPCPVLDTPPVPLGPEGVTTFTQPTFSWRPVTGIDEYVVLVLLASDEEQTVWLGHAEGRTSITAPPLPVNTPMRWKVKTECDEHYSAFSATLYFTIEPSGGSCPGAPTVLGPQPGRGNDAQPTFTWVAVPGATSYTVYVQSGTSDAIIASEMDIHGTTFTPPTPLPVGVPLRWKVKAEGACGAGPYSPIVYFDVGPPNPCALVGPATPYAPQGTLIRNRPLLRWGPAPNGTFHTLYLHRQDTGALLLAEVVYGTTFTMPADLPVGVPLRWFVQGSNACGDGLYSAAAQFRIR